MKINIKQQLLFFLLGLSILCSSSVLAQNAIPNAGLVEQSVPKGSEFNQQEEFQPDANTTKADVDDTTTEEVEQEDQQEEVSQQPAAQTGATVVVKGFNVNPSEIIPKEELDKITEPYLNKSVSINDLKEIVNEINKVYVKKGYITARAFLPPQTVKDGIVEIKLVEGHIGQVNVEGNKWTRTSYIVGKLHQKDGDLFSLQTLEKDILNFNRDNQVKLRANLKPGKEFGTTDINLVASDPMPWHVTPTFDNTGRETVGILRGGIAVSTDSLLGYQDQFVMGYSRAKSTDVAYSSYSFPVGNYGTRIGGNFAFSNIKISKGPFKDFNIEGNSYNYGGFITHPFIRTRRFDLIGDIGVNFRQSTTFFDEVTLFTTQVRSLTVGLTADVRDKYGRTNIRNSFTNGLDLLGGNARFFKYNGSLTRIHSFGKGIIGIFRAATQLTDDRLPPIEQFQVGGSSTVRGYSEGLLIGDNGYLFSAEIRFPLPFLPEKIGKLAVKDRIRALVFVDHGAAFVDDGDTTSPHHNNFLTGVGFGLRGSITKYISGRVDWGFGLGRREDPQPTARLHFGLQANPI